MPRTITWCRVPGASSLACRGTLFLLLLQMTLAVYQPTILVNLVNNVPYDVPYD
jgi:hypothetical protein